MDKIIVQSGLVFLGGGLGSVLRFLLGLACRPLSFVFPLATLLANLLAACLIGFLFTRGYKDSSGIEWPLFAVGFCGGLSTFSAFSLETADLFKNGNLTMAWINIALSVTLCILAVIVFSTFYTTNNE